jgi:hypothetical protein
MQELIDDRQQRLLLLTGLTNDTMIFFKDWKYQISEDLYTYLNMCQALHNCYIDHNKSNTTWWKLNKITQQGPIKIFNEIFLQYITNIHPRPSKADLLCNYTHTINKTLTILV